MYEYGTWRNMIVYKDKKGFYVYPRTSKIIGTKKYLKGWKQKTPTMRIYKGKWQIIKTPRNTLGKTKLLTKSNVNNTH